MGSGQKQSDSSCSSGISTLSKNWISQEVWHITKGGKALKGKLLSAKPDETLEEAEEEYKKADKAMKTKASTLNGNMVKT